MRDETLRQAKATLRAFFAGQDDKYLTRLIDKCRNGYFRFDSTCNCVRGICEGGYGANNSIVHRRAEMACAVLAEGFVVNSMDGWDHLRGDTGRAESAKRVRARVLPMALAEIRRRGKAQQPAPVAAEVEA